MNMDNGRDVKLEVERLRVERIKMESAIADATRDAVQAFKQATGMTPSSIYVEMVRVDRLGARVEEYIVGSVTTKVEI